MRISLQSLIGKRDIIGAEIGVEEGNNANSILQELNIKKLYLIDPYIRGNEYKKVAHDLLKQYDSVEFVYKKSSEVLLNEIPAYSLDFVYIDGDHSYSGCYSDLQNYFSRVKPGGIVAGHDWSWPDDNIKNAVNNFISSCIGLNVTLNIVSDNINDDWWFIKP